ncbi:MAG: hypothetical protein JXK95_05835 [Bacteroidales bacterium]|nr:hypothetical protein [Bacteroidales bacterium]
MVKKIFHFTVLAVYTGMSINKKEFIANLDSVLELFRQFKERMIRNNTGVDHTFIRNFDEIIHNYQIIREEIPEELVSKFGMPIQVMALQLIEQLRKELEWQQRDNQKQKMKQSIDDLLKNPSISEPEINALLDKRIEIMKKDTAC